MEMAIDKFQLKEGHASHFFLACRWGLMSIFDMEKIETIWNRMVYLGTQAPLFTISKLQALVMLCHVNSLPCLWGKYILKTKIIAHSGVY